jgi:hypothetical protein
MGAAPSIAFTGRHYGKISKITLVWPGNLKGIVNRAFIMNAASLFVSLVAIETTAVGKRPVARGHPLQRPPAPVLVRFDLDGAIPGGDDIQLIAFLQPSFSTSAFGNRTARLLPHFEIRIAASMISRS